MMRSRPPESLVPPPPANRVTIASASPWWTNTESRFTAHAPSPNNFQIETILEFQEIMELYTYHLFCRGGPQNERFYQR
jgi:hypothetical protein